MPTLQSTEEVPVSSDSARVGSNLDPAPSGLLPPTNVSWNFKAWIALLSLAALWAMKIYTTWAAWGNLTIDSGHEMYVPALLAEGKVLYRDVQFTYGPAAPYFTSYLFRLFGIRLDVLYWAGSLSALGSAVFLYVVGMELSFRLVGWTAAAVVLLEAFQPSLFCYPLPYSFAAVYGCLVGCLFLWLVVHASLSGSWAWMLGAGVAAAVALLLKPEFGVASYGTLFLLILARRLAIKSNKVLGQDLLAILPGIVICGLVIRWMVSIAGVEFITQENILSWPTNYFMRAYGKVWLAQNGFTLAGGAFLGAAKRTIPVLIVASAAYCALRLKRTGTRSIQMAVGLLVAAILYLAGHIFLIFLPPPGLESALSTIFFPLDMVLYVAMAAVGGWWYYWRTLRSIDSGGPGIPLLFTFSSLVAFRILMKMSADNYPIYYNGPAVLSFLLLMCLLVPRSGRSRLFVFMAELVICLACLTPVALHARKAEAQVFDYVPLKTERGMVRVPEPLAENYKAAIRFMKEKASQGISVLSVPEDTSLYFLSGTYCPTRVYFFIPGSVAPGKMTSEVIAEIERKPVGYLLWSNRTFSEYGANEFGKDFDREIGEYLKTHYRPVGRLIPQIGVAWNWNAIVWERKLEGNR